MSTPSMHPIVGFAHAVDEALDRVMPASTVAMSAGDEADALITLGRVRSRLAALEMRVIAGAGRVVEDGAHRSVADYLAHATNADRGPLAATERLAASLERWTVLAEAVATGRVSIDKAHVIVRTLENLLSDSTVPAEVLDSAEQHLVGLAPSFPASQLRRLGRKVLEVVAPALGHDAEARALAAEERRASETMSLTMRHAPDGVEGVTQIRGRIPTSSALRLQTYLEAITSPRHDGPTPPTERLPRDRKLALAFCTLLEILDPNRLPLHGGAATTVMVTLDLDTLRHQVGAADLSGSAAGQIRISAAEARRLACTADLIPVVLGRNSEPLDLGRTARLFSSAQRKAMALRDRTCRAEGCDIPANWCEAHHKQPWSQGGKTELDNGHLLCPWHHHRTHDDRYLTNQLPNGDVRFTRRR